MIDEEEAKEIVEENDWRVGGNNLVYDEEGNVSKDKIADAFDVDSDDWPEKRDEVKDIIRKYSEDPKKKDDTRGETKNQSNDDIDDFVNEEGSSGEKEDDDENMFINKKTRASNMLQEFLDELNDEYGIGIKEKAIKMLKRGIERSGKIKSPEELQRFLKDANTGVSNNEEIRWISEEYREWRERCIEKLGYNTDKIDLGSSSTIEITESDRYTSKGKNEVTKLGEEDKEDNTEKKVDVSEGTENTIDKMKKQFSDLNQIAMQAKMFDMMSGGNVSRAMKMMGHDVPDEIEEATSGSKGREVTERDKMMAQMLMQQMQNQEKSKKDEEMEDRIANAIDSLNQKISAMNQRLNQVENNGGSNKEKDKIRETMENAMAQKLEQNLMGDNQQQNQGMNRQEMMAMINQMKEELKSDIEPQMQNIQDMNEHSVEAEKAKWDAYANMEAAKRRSQAMKEAVNTFSKIIPALGEHIGMGFAKAGAPNNGGARQPQPQQRQPQQQPQRPQGNNGGQEPMNPARMEQKLNQMEQKIQETNPGEKIEENNPMEGEEGEAGVSIDNPEFQIDKENDEIHASHCPHCQHGFAEDGMTISGEFGNGKVICPNCSRPIPYEPVE